MGKYEPKTKATELGVADSLVALREPRGALDEREAEFASEGALSAGAPG